MSLNQKLLSAAFLGLTVVFGSAQAQGQTAPKPGTVQQKQNPLRITPRDLRAEEKADPQAIQKAVSAKTGSPAAYVAVQGGDALYQQTLSALEDLKNDPALAGLDIQFLRGGDVSGASGKVTIRFNDGGGGFRMYGFLCNKLDAAQFQSTLRVYKARGDYALHMPAANKAGGFTYADAGSLAADLSAEKKIYAVLMPAADYPLQDKIFQSLADIRRDPKNAGARFEIVYYTPSNAPDGKEAPGLVSTTDLSRLTFIPFKDGDSFKAAVTEHLKKQPVQAIEFDAF